VYYAVMCSDLRTRDDVQVERRSWRSSALKIARVMNAAALAENSGETTGPDGLPVRLYYLERVLSEAERQKERGRQNVA